ncbi:MAG: LysM peptidoglycan-binding domain-containing protein [Bacteroidia bacterium]|nr:LysM peptidoglycan-binding domain-containing protein [Bacteroidia bacterium]NNJ55740.1 LysM peptidoglycan-binding domain-containing protein [Bacteroidia bacterium]
MKVKTLFVFMLIPILSFAQLSDNLIVQRLDSLNSKVELDYSDRSRPYIFDFTNNFNNKTSKTLSNFNRVDIPLKQIFLKYNVPVELRFACISLSNCNNFYKDDQGRAGFFKLRYGAAVNNGLYISNYVDERRDVLKSAEAFCKELNKLYNRTRDWKLAYTIYNAGELQWERAKSESADSLSDFWLINSYLPGIHESEYAKYIAAVYIANYHQQHNIKAFPLKIRVEKVPIRKLTTLYQLSSKLDIEYNLFKELNPIYKKGIIPNSGRDYYVNLPINKVKDFYDFGYEAYNYTEIKTYSNTQIKLIEVKGNSPSDSAFVLDEEPSKDVVEVSYSVRNGDMLLTIADYFDCEVVEIKRWNKLKSEKLDIDQKLIIWVPRNQRAFYQKIDNMSNAERRRLAKKD